MLLFGVQGIIRGFADSGAKVARQRRTFERLRSTALAVASASGCAAADVPSARHVFFGVYENRTVEDA